MQIHELNDFVDELNDSAFLAVDNGSDTGKISAKGLTASFNDDINALNARIDNIIAGGDAPSAAEVTDARLGFDGVTSASLGDSIRGQAGGLAADLESEQTDGLFHKYITWEHGGIDNSTGQNNNEGSLVRSRTPGYFSCSDYEVITNSSNKYVYIIYYDENQAYKAADSLYSSVPTRRIRKDYAYFRLDYRSGIDDTRAVKLFEKSAFVSLSMKVANNNDFTRLSGDMFEQGGLRNSTGAEYDQTAYVRSLYIPVIPGINVEITNKTNANFYYSIHQYDIAKNWLSALTAESNRELNNFTINANCYFIRIVILHNNYAAITPPDVDSSVIWFRWYFDSTTFYREPFAYIGNAGHFVFKSNDIFDSVGRCAWRITSSDKLNLKLPNKTTPVSWSTDQLIAGLTSSDLLTDADGVTWIYLRAGRALVYNTAASALEVVEINANVPLGNNSYPLLMVWSSQAVGGLIYNKFLYDVQNVTIENHVDTNLEIKLDNARHIKGNAAIPLTLLHFSDLHKDQLALSRIIDDMQRIKTGIDDIICTGDMVPNTAEPIASWWDERVLTCIGNHDTASYNSIDGYDWTALSMADRDDYYIAPFESNWNIVHTSGTSYYYKDYTDQAIRLIVMDAMLYTDNGAEAAAQTAWLTNLLNDAIANSLHVLIAIHAPHGGSTAIECSFSRYNQATMPVNADCDTPQAVIDAVATAISGGLNFVGYIVGHTHQDNIWDATGDGSQLMYCVTCAIVSQEAQWINSDQYRGTDADAYNLVTIDTANTLVKIIRGGGADMDDHMRPRRMICFDYSTGTMVGEEK